MQFSAILTLFALTGAMLSPTFSPAHAQGRTTTQADEAVIDMAQAYKQRDRKRLAALLPQVKGTMLEPWAAYWDLSVRLDEAGKTELQDFFTRYAGTYQEDKLRSELLHKLGRDRDWTAFAAHYPLYRMQDDRSLRCYNLWADYAANGTDVSRSVAETWLSLRDADDACGDAAAQLIKDHKLDSHIAWIRARLGLENDKLRVATQAVEALDNDWAKTVNTIYLNPGKYLNDKLTAVRPKTRELVSLAMIRLAYIDPAEAASEIDKLRWRAQLTAEERSWVWGVIGKRMAQKLSPDALAYFAKGQWNQMHEDHLAWAARAALRTGHWEVVHDAIAAMPESMRNESIWMYWRARALLQTESEVNREEALRLLVGMANSKGFYEQLALEEIGQRITLPEKPTPLTAEDKEAARRNPGLQRALYAIQIGLRSEGVREWNYTTNLHTKGGMDDRDLLAAADLACRAEVWDRCINTSERTRMVIDMEQRFPMPYRSTMLARTKHIGLDPAYVYGLIRQESRFITDAKSNVGANGLMQLMPATARWTAKKIGLTDYQSHHITDRDTNITIGTGYLKLLVDNFNGSLPMAAAAYNAGPGRPRAWRGQPGDATLEGAIWAENIPFSETRDYVKKVLANTTNYAALITGRPQSLKSRLGSVGPKDPNVVDADLP